MKWYVDGRRFGEMIMSTAVATAGKETNVPVSHKA